MRLLKFFIYFGDLIIVAFFCLGLYKCVKDVRADANPPNFDLVIGFYSSANGHRVDAPSYDYILHIPEPTDAVCEFAAAGAHIGGGKQARKTADITTELVDAQCVRVRR